MRLLRRKNVGDDLVLLERRKIGNRDFEILSNLDEFGFFLFRQFVGGQQRGPGLNDRREFLLLLLLLIGLVEMVSAA
jgi:hypothetical protein